MSNRVDGYVVLDNITEKISRKDKMEEKKKNDWNEVKKNNDLNLIQ